MHINLNCINLSGGHQGSRPEKLDDHWVFCVCDDWDVFRSATSSLDEYIVTVTSHISFCENWCVPSCTKGNIDNTKPMFTSKLMTFMVGEGRHIQQWTVWQYSRCIIHGGDDCGFQKEFSTTHLYHHVWISSSCVESSFFLGTNTHDLRYAALPPKDHSRECPFCASCSYSI